MKIVPKVWGREEWIINNEFYCLKYLYLTKGYKCSLHKHIIKNESFILKSGSVFIEYDNKKCKMNINVPIMIKSNIYHRFTGLEDSVIMEISTQHLESDSYRKTKSGKVGDV